MFCCLIQFLGIGFRSLCAAFAICGVKGCFWIGILGLCGVGTNRVCRGICTDSCGDCEYL